MYKFCHLFSLILLLTACQSSDISSVKKISADVWQPDLGNGFYKNPIIHADYSDPDVIRVNDTFYLTASSFNKAPGLPLLESKDMIHWEIVGYALPQLIPTDFFAVPQPGKGVWAPCLRYHDGKFWIFYPDPDFGIYVMTAKNFRGPWSTPHLLLAGKGIIDPTPLWDDDGQAYLLHAWAKSRAGINNLLTLRKMSTDAQKILDDSGKIVIDGNQLPNYRTLEGPKFYKRNGYYYVFAPAGGVETGWQSVFRAKKIEGPYEDKIVMDQGDSSVNGPHQGAWVENADGSDWFFHFQDKNAYGRIVHLQPMIWENDWPVIGEDKKHSGKGEPVLIHKKPINLNAEIKNPATSDDFATTSLGNQWQWNANWKDSWYSLSSHRGFLRLYAQNDSHFQSKQNLWLTPSILSQKIPAEEFNVSVKINTAALTGRAGLMVYGLNTAVIGVERQATTQHIYIALCENTEKDCHEVIEVGPSFTQRDIYLSLEMQAEAVVNFSFSLDGIKFNKIGKPITASKGKWVGAQLGLFAIAQSANKDNFVDIDYFYVTKK